MVLGFIFNFTQVQAQVKFSKFDATYIWNHAVFPVAKQRIAYVSADMEGVYVSTYDTTSAIAWEKDYPLTKDRSRNNKFVASAKGEDLWVISYYTGSRDPQECTVLWIDALTGESKSKTHAAEEFGYVYSTWANSKYFFVLTTKYEMTDKNISKEPTMNLYRFDKSNLEMKKLEHDFDTPTAFEKVFWEIVRVEEEFVEGYAVSQAGSNIEVKFRRFDNNGKKVLTSAVAFAIKEEEHFTRQIHGYCTPGPGIGESNHNYYTYAGANADIIELIYPTSSVQVAYCAKTSTYYLCGVIGPGEQAKLGTIYDGIFLAKVNADHKLEAYKEYIDEPIMTKDKNFEVHESPANRYIKCLFDMNGNPFVDFGAETAYRYLIDQGDLSLVKALDKQSAIYGVAGGVYIRQNSLRMDPIYRDATGRFDKYWDVVSGNWEYAFRQDQSSGDISVFTKRVAGL